jgi:hypothetical protein
MTYMVDFVIKMAQTKHQELMANQDMLGEFFNACRIYVLKESWAPMRLLFPNEHLSFERFNESTGKIVVRFMDGSTIQQSIHLEGETANG